MNKINEMPLKIGTVIRRQHIQTPITLSGRAYEQAPITLSGRAYEQARQQIFPI